MASYRYAKVPAQGARVGYDGGALHIPANRVIAFIEGDGTGPNISRAPVRVSDAAVERAYEGNGPLATPVGTRVRSLSVTLGEVIDLYACIRPVRYFDGVVNPMKQPEKPDVVIFQENAEDGYGGATEVPTSAFGDRVIRSMAA